MKINVKKFMMVLMMAVTMAGVFAYVPKKECVTVKGNKVRYEETYKGFVITKTRLWTYKIKSGKFIYQKRGTFDYMWRSLLTNRESYDISLKVASFRDETCSTCALLEKYRPAYENGELSETEMKQYESIVQAHQAANNIKGAIEGHPAHAKTGTRSYYEVCANDAKRKAINEIPFVTEENWYTITREELLDKIRAFVDEVKADCGIKIKEIKK